MEVTSADGGAEGPSVRRRRRVVPILIVTMAVAASCTSIAWATRLPPRPRYPTSDYVPADGTLVMETVANGAVTDDAGQSTNVTEQAILRGAEGVVALAGSFGDAVMDAAASAGVTQTELSVWRSTSLLVQDGVADEQSGTAYLESPDGLLMTGTWGPQLSLQFRPALVVLPNDLSPGSTWTSSGDALPEGILTYTFDGRITAHDGDGCVTLDGEFHLDQPGAGSFLSYVSTEQWCPEAGPRFISATYTFSDGSTETVTNRQVPEDPQLLPDLAGDAAHDAPGGAEMATPSVDGWTVTALPTERTDALFGQLAVGGTAAGPLVVTPDGRVLLGYESGDDVVSFDVHDGLAGADEGGSDEAAGAPAAPTLLETWRAHPGSELLTMGAVGDLVVVTTTDREVVAYDADGVRRWTAGTRDLVLGPVAATAGGAAVTVGLDGAVIARDAATGEELWQVQLVTDADRPATVVGDIVVATDRGGTLIGVDAASGDTRWEATGDAILAMGAAPGDVVVTADDYGIVEARDALTGDLLWDAQVPNYVDTIVGTADGVVVVSDGTATAFADDGTTLWSVAGGEAVAAVGSTVFLMRGDDVIALDENGEEIARWAIPVSFPGIAHSLVAGHDGVWVYDSTAVVHRLGDLP